MTHYTATIRHHSISRARHIDCGSDLTVARKLAIAEFDTENRDYMITIIEHRDGVAPEIISERKVSGGKWADR